MNRKETRAYNELIGLLLSGDDQERFEWCIGAMLSEGPQLTVAFFGDTRSGKTTLMNIVRTLAFDIQIGGRRQVTFLVDNNTRSDFGVETFTFVELNDEQLIDPEFVVIRTTGERLPVNRFHVLTQEVNSELYTIAEDCMALYRRRGFDYYHRFLENNR